MSDVLPLESAEHVVVVRQAVRQRAVDLGFSLVDQTKIVTAASELGRNTIQHGGGGRALIEIINDGTRKGLRLTFEDQGPGIADIALAMRDGIIPPTVNLEVPDPVCDLDHVPNVARKRRVEVALSNSFGFGGHNNSLIFTAFQD